MWLFPVPLPLDAPPMAVAQGAMPPRPVFVPEAAPQWGPMSSMLELQLEVWAAQQLVPQDELESESAQARSQQVRSVQVSPQVPELGPLRPGPHSQAEPQLAVLPSELAKLQPVQPALLLPLEALASQLQAPPEWEPQASVAQPPLAQGQPPDASVPLLLPRPSRLFPPWP